MPRVQRIMNNLQTVLLETNVVTTNLIQPWTGSNGNEFFFLYSSDLQNWILIIRCRVRFRAYYHPQNTSLRMMGVLSHCMGHNQRILSLADGDVFFYVFFFLFYLLHYSIIIYLFAFVFFRFLVKICFVWPQRILVVQSACSCKVVTHLSNERARRYLTPGNPVEDESEKEK